MHRVSGQRTRKSFATAAAETGIRGSARKQRQEQEVGKGEGKNGRGEKGQRRKGEKGRIGVLCPFSQRANVLTF